MGEYPSGTVVPHQCLDRFWSRWSSSSKPHDQPQGGRDNNHGRSVAVQSLSTTKGTRGCVIIVSSSLWVVSHMRRSTQPPAPSLGFASSSSSSSNSSPQHIEVSPLSTKPSPSHPRLSPPLQQHQHHHDYHVRKRSRKKQNRDASTPYQGGDFISSAPPSSVFRITTILLLMLGGLAILWATQTMMMVATPRSRPRPPPPTPRMRPPVSFHASTLPDDSDNHMITIKDQNSVPQLDERGITIKDPSQPQRPHINHPQLQQRDQLPRPPPPSATWVRTDHVPATGSMEELIASRQQERARRRQESFHQARKRSGRGFFYDRYGSQAAALGFDYCQPQEPPPGSPTTAQRSRLGPPRLYPQLLLAAMNDTSRPKHDQSHLIVVVIMSARDHFEQRRAIRETWGQGQPIYFVIGGPYLVAPDVTTNHTSTNTSQEQEQQQQQQRWLQQEQDQYGDLLDAILPESYRSLAYKLKFAYQTIMQHYPWQVKWILKVDDDTMARVGPLQQALLLLEQRLPRKQQEQQQQQQGIRVQDDQHENHASVYDQMVVLGNIQVDQPVHRNGPWAEDPDRYAAETYPYFPLGSCGHVVSRAVAEYVVQHAPSLPCYQGEDVSLGLWLLQHQAFNISFSFNSAEGSSSSSSSWSQGQGVSVTWIHAPTYFVNHRNCLHGDPNWWVLGHNVNPSQMRLCHRPPEPLSTGGNVVTRTTTEPLRRRPVREDSWQLEELVVTTAGGSSSTDLGSNPGAAAALPGQRMVWLRNQPPPS